MSRAASVAELTGVTQPLGVPLPVGFLNAQEDLILPTGNLQGNLNNAAIPAIPDVPTYGPQMAWNVAPRPEPADPTCRMLAYPGHCSLLSALPQCYPAQEVAYSQYPYASAADVSLADGNPMQLGDPGVFVPASRTGGLLAQPVAEGKARFYGNVESFNQWLTDKKDGPVRSCSVYFSCQQPVPSMAGYQSASVDPTTLHCQPTYLKTVPCGHTKVLPPTAFAVAMANGPLMDSNTNAFLPGQGVIPTPAGAHAVSSNSYHASGLQWENPTLAHPAPAGSATTTLADVQSGEWCGAGPGNSFWGSCGAGQCCYQRGLEPGNCVDTSTGLCAEGAPASGGGTPPQPPQNGHHPECGQQCANEQDPLACVDKCEAAFGT